MLDAASIAPEEIRPLQRIEYDRLVALGWFQDERIELLHGLLVAMSPQGSRHALALSRLVRQLIVALGARAEVRPQCPLAVSDDSEPEPDIAVVAPGDYRDAHPTTALLVVEIADASLKRDRGVKARLYAACSIPEYWIVNLVDDVVEIHTDPRADAYQRIMRFESGARVTLVMYPDVTIEFNDLL
jgi:Uma2 family endonuclease